MIASTLFVVLSAIIQIASSSPTPSTEWWKPDVGTTWQIQLDKPVTNVSWARQVYDFDLFDNPVSMINEMHKLNRKVICYYSAGSWEKWRPDAGKFKPSDLGKKLDGWPGERWLNVSSPNVRKIMVERIELAKHKGCDGVDPDNVDGYDNDNGLGLTKEDAVNYVEFLTAEAHKRGLASGLKNAGAIVKDVLHQVDYQVNEQCAQYHECETFAPFITAGKPVFHIEYHKTIDHETITKSCDARGEKRFSTLIKHLDLGDWAVLCP